MLRFQPRVARFLDGLLLLVSLLLFNLFWFIPRIGSPIWGAVLALSMTAAMLLAYRIHKSRKRAKQARSAARMRFVEQRLNELFWLAPEAALSECLELLRTQHSVEIVEREQSGTIALVDGRRLWISVLQRCASLPPEPTDLYDCVRNARIRDAQPLLISLAEYPTNCRIAAQELEPAEESPLPHPLFIGPRTLARWLPEGELAAPDLPDASWQRIRKRLLRPELRKGYLRCALLLLLMYLFTNAWYMLPPAFLALFAARVIRMPVESKWP